MRAAFFLGFLSCGRLDMSKRIRPCQIPAKLPVANAELESATRDSNETPTLVENFTVPIYPRIRLAF